MSPKITHRVWSRWVLQAGQSMAKIMETRTHGHLRKAEDEAKISWRWNAEEALRTCLSWAPWPAYCVITKTAPRIPRPRISISLKYFGLSFCLFNYIYYWNMTNLGVDFVPLWVVGMSTVQPQSFKERNETRSWNQLRRFLPLFSLLPHKKIFLCWPSITPQYLLPSWMDICCPLQRIQGSLKLATDRRLSLMVNGLLLDLQI